VAVTVQAVAASRAESPFRDPPAFLLVTTGKRIAEREVRMSKLRIKVSGSMRSIAGARAFRAIRSCLSTAAKHGISKLDALIRAASGSAWVPQTP
jgi:hypothetical protein